MELRRRGKGNDVLLGEYFSLFSNKYHQYEQGKSSFIDKYGGDWKRNILSPMPRFCSAGRSRECICVEKALRSTRTFCIPKSP